MGELKVLRCRVGKFNKLHTSHNVFGTANLLCQYPQSQVKKKKFSDLSKLLSERLGSW